MLVFATKSSSFKIRYMLELLIKKLKVHTDGTVLLYGNADLDIPFLKIKKARHIIYLSLIINLFLAMS